MWYIQEFEGCIYCLAAPQAAWAVCYVGRMGVCTQYSGYSVYGCLPCSSPLLAASGLALPVPGFFLWQLSACVSLSLSVSFLILHWMPGGAPRRGENIFF